MIHGRGRPDFAKLRWVTGANIEQHAAKAAVSLVVKADECLLGVPTRR